MKIAGVSVILVLGLLNLALLSFQLSTGLRWVKVPFGTHRRIGIAIFVMAVIHGTLGIFTQF